LSNKPDNPQKRTERRKLLSAEARHILSVCEGRPITNDDIVKDKAGRPFFHDRKVQGTDTDFNISHSGALAAVSLVRGKNLHTGCDVEFVRPRARAREIAEEFFTVPEIEYIDADSRFDGTRFYQIWTLKECYLKLRGFSVFEMANVPSFISREGSYTFGSVGVFPVLFDLYELTGNTGEHYILAAAFEGTEVDQPEIRWFSHVSLDCKSIAKIKAAPSPAETVRPKI